MLQNNMLAALPSKSEKKKVTYRETWIKRPGAY